MKIKDILKIDLSEEIKNVIDLENLSEKEIKEEIENYIVTKGLAKDFEDFVSVYLSNMQETGVWISGFYGSGKSYFGKMLGYLLNNKNILGTPARNRILQRFSGIEDESLIKNTISRLNTIKSRVIFMDIAKQNTNKGFAYTLFKNFLKSLNLPENEHGYFLFQLMLEQGETDVNRFVQKFLNKNWDELKSNMISYTTAIKEIYMKSGKTEEDYENLLETIRREIDEFDAGKLRDLLNSYLQIEKEERIVFLFDEASEAINQKKFSLLDLEGVSEALSSLGNRVWTIAIAQEKLDDVINNSNIDKAQLTKVTDRFKTKIHLEATEVDYIIKNRLLDKTEQGIDVLADHFKKHSGQIADHSSLTGAGIEKTDNIKTYTTYYPFYKYQFDLLQNFLFGTKGYVSTKVAARGMIITTYDILRKEVKEEELFDTVTGWQIAKEAQPSPPVRLVNRYDNADRILRADQSVISGRKLLETINFLSEAEVTPANLDNIVKAYIKKPEDFHRLKDDIEKALNRLTEAKILIHANAAYRITSDIEQRLLDEMNNYQVQGFVKKQVFTKILRNSRFIRAISRITDNNQTYDFYITTDNGDELTSPANKHLKVKIKSLYSISDNRNEDIESLKVQHQQDKDLMWIVPDNSGYAEIDKLIDEIERISHLQEKYNNPNSEEGKILTTFSTQKSEKENRLRQLIEKAVTTGELIYLYDVLKLNEDNAVPLTQKKQKELIDNVYTKRLTNQLGDDLARVIIKETNNKRLHTYFHGEDFQFFDSEGNFIGDNLTVTEEILYKIRNTFVDGRTLEIELSNPPTGFSFGTIITTLAVLMRAGKVIAKYNGKDFFSWRDQGVSEIFSKAREFRKASFKARIKHLSYAEQNDIIQFLLETKAGDYIDKKIDFNTNDFELVNAIRHLANYFVHKVENLKKYENEFDRLFPEANRYVDLLKQFTAPVSEANFIDKAREFLSEKTAFAHAIKQINKIEKFISNRLPVLKQWKKFVNDVEEELKKAAVSDEELQRLIEEFNEKYENNVVENFAGLQQLAQKIKDRYHQLFSEAMKACASKYSEIQETAQQLLDEIESLPTGLNDHIKPQVQSLLNYARQRANPQIDLDFDVKDKNSRFTYSEVLSFIELYPGKKRELDNLKSALKRKEQTSGEKKQPKKYRISLPARTMSVREFKQWLQQELQEIASADDNDQITIDL